MPHPKGAITVSLVQIKTGWTADVTLPSQTPGDFVWQGRTYPLRMGTSTRLTLPRRN